MSEEEKSDERPPSSSKPEFFHKPPTLTVYPRNRIMRGVIYHSCLRLETCPIKGHDMFLLFIVLQTKKASFKKWLNMKNIQTRWTLNCMYWTFRQACITLWNCSRTFVIKTEYNCIQRLMFRFEIFNYKFWKPYETLHSFKNTSSHNCAWHSKKVCPPYLTLHIIHRYQTTIWL